MKAGILFINMMSFRKWGNMAVASEPYRFIFLHGSINRITSLVYVAQNCLKCASKTQYVQDQTNKSELNIISILSNIYTQILLKSTTDEFLLGLKMAYIKGLLCLYICIKCSKLQLQMRNNLIKHMFILFFSGHVTEAFDGASMIFNTN